MSKRIPRLLPAALVALALVATACGSGGGGSKSKSASFSGAGFPATIRAANGPVTIDKRPSRIVSLSATATEMLFAIGAGRQVVAVDATSDYPPSAPKKSLDAQNPNIEAITSYRPDLLVVAEDTAGVLDNAKRLGVPALLEPAAKRLSDSYAQLDQLGRATGHQPAATAVAKQMRDRIGALAAEVPKRTKPLTYYHELDDTLFTVTSDTFVGQVYRMAGLHDVADATADKAGGYPQLSNEFVVQSNPDLIFLADTKCCHQSPATAAARPGWSTLRAIKGSDVIPLDDDIASRWGPRVVDFFQTIIDAVKKAEG